MNASADFSALVVKSIRMQDMVVVSSAQNATVAVGKASLSEVVKYLSKPAAARPFEIRTAEKIYRPDDEQRTGVPLIEAGVLVTAERAAQYQEQLTALDIVLCSNGAEFSDRILERAISSIQEERANQTRSAQEKAEQISAGAMEAYRLLKQILDSMTGVESSIKEKMLDPRVVASLRILNGVITRVYGAIHEAAEDLLDGGRIIAILHGIHPPSDKEAEIALKTATSAMMCGYNTRLFDTGGLAKLFLAGLLLNCFNWGGRKVPSGHEESSAGIIEAMREQGCDLPEGLEDIVRVHSNRELIGRYVYRIDINAESTHTDESETGIGRTFLVERDRAGLESRITREQNIPLNFGTGVSSLAAAGIKSLRLEVRMLGKTEHASVIILALVEEFYERTEKEKPDLPHAVLESMLSRTGYSVLEDFEPEHDASHTTMFAKVIIALANTFRILFAGMVVEITDTGIVHRAIRRQVGVGCRGVVISVDSYLGPVIDMCKLGETWLQWPRGLGVMQPVEFVNIRINDKGVPSRFIIPLGVSVKGKVFKRLITCVGIARAKTFAENFQHIVDRIVPGIAQYYRGRERTPAGQ